MADGVPSPPGAGYRTSPSSGRSPGRGLTPSPLAIVAILAIVALFAACESGPSPVRSPDDAGIPTGSPTLQPGTTGAASAATPTGAPSTPSRSSPTPELSLGPAPAIRLEPSALVEKALAITAVAGGGLLVAGQDGRLWELSGAGRLDPPVLDIAARISTGGERGLLGIAVHPRFPADPRLFVDYTDRNGDTVVAWFPLQRDASTGRLSADPGREQMILRVAQPFSNHNGGALAFGPDGFLYVALGDGGSGGDPQGNGQRLDTLLGKILRLDIGTSDERTGYAIPAGNPFADRVDARPEIWAYGLRNPWRFSFDRGAGDLWIGDVGQSAWEEVDVLAPGAGGLNLGWNVMEGRHCYPAGSSCDPAGLVLPVAEYAHGPGCSITGGVVYRGREIPGLAGRYLFADYCSGEIMAIPAGSGPGLQTVEVLLRGPGGPAAFGEDATGEVYVANVAEGTVSRIVAAP